MEGALHTKPVVETLRDYLRDAGELLEAAERKLEIESEPKPEPRKRTTKKDADN